MAVWKDKPPVLPAGIHRADSDCFARWALSGYIYPPYQFRDEFLLWKGNSWRLTNSQERCLLMGYGFQHCDLAWSANKIKADAAGYEREKCSLLGDAFSMYSFVVVGAALCKNRLPRVHFHHLAQRMALAPGFRANLRLRALLAWSLQYGCQQVAETQGNLQVRDLNLVLLARTNFTGSDVRVVTGQLVNPRAFRRQSIAAAWWKWNRSFRVRWPKPQNINQLELKAVLLSVLRGIRSERWSQQRVFHLSDSYVSISVVAKGRSSSAHVESTENPTDGESRR